MNRISWAERASAASERSLWRMTWGPGPRPSGIPAVHGIFDSTVYFEPTDRTDRSNRPLEPTVRAGRKMMRSTLSGQEIEQNGSQKPK